MNPNEAAGSSKLIDNSEEYGKKCKEIDQLIEEGKKLFNAASYGEAADKYEIAMKSATEFFGEFSHECLQPALNYGKALIEVARSNLQIVDQPLDKIYEDDEGVEDEADEDQEDQAAYQQDGQKMEEDNKPEEDHKTNQEEKMAEIKGVLTKENANEIDDQTLATENGEINLAEEDEENDADDIQTAWEWLEVARKICEKQEETTYWLEWKSEVLMALGECLTVADEFEQALGEFLNALEIRQKIFVHHDRHIAETHFFIALAQRNLGRFDKAADEYEKAKQILEGAIDAKKKKIDSDKSNSKKLAEEIVEMDDLIKSIEENIRDARESAESCPQKAEIVGLLPETKTLPNNPEEVVADGVEVNDLSELVKRKTVKRPLVEKSIENTEMKKSENGTVNEKKEFNGNGVAEELSLQPEQKRVKISADEGGNVKETE